MILSQECTEEIPGGGGGGYKKHIALVITEQTPGPFGQAFAL